MSATINISLPTQMYKDIKSAMKAQGYASVSEYIRSSIRTQIYPRITENGFTPEFENEVLQAAAEPIDEGKVWETEADIDEYFDNLEKKVVSKP
ncbi:MAG: ribbon-helix-helix domain-containing protein [bacterium]|nr:ribbon-helix-helix domain-containing protein [bacterium]